MISDLGFRVWGFRGFRVWGLGVSAFGGFSKVCFSLSGLWGPETV